MKIISKFFVLSLSVISMVFSSCKDHRLEMFADVKGTYFSIKKFSLDEWTTHAGEPISFVKTVKKDGKTDSSIVNIEHLDWPEILEIFTETDISDRKWLGLYTFSQFEDNFDNTHNFMYVANKKEMYTQKLLITMDINTMKVKGVYIETLKSSFWNETLQKLYYEPVNTIQIQQYDKPLIGSKKETITKYSAIVKE